MIPLEDVGTPQCELCKLILKEIEKLIVGQVTEEKIINAVHHACKAVPKFLSKECNRFIDKHGAEIIKLLESSVVPKEVCKMLQLCNTKLEIVKLEIRSCAICQVGADQMVQILQGPKVNHLPENIFEKTCQALPVGHQTLCDTVMLFNGAQLLKMLSDGVDPRSVCIKAELCTEEN